jgi:hypothetical protein
MARHAIVEGPLAKFLPRVVKMARAGEKAED